jgi:hypothetical protein
LTSLMQRRWRFSPGCRLALDNNSLLITTSEQQILCESARPDVIRDLLLRLDGEAIPQALAAEYGVGANALEAVLSALLESDLLLDADRAADAANPAEMAAALRLEARFWALPIFEQPFWETLLAGHSSRAQVLGWGLEFYHFVEAANLYMALGVAHTRHAPHMREAIARHYIEEMHHGTIFLDGLVACGIERASLLAAPPLPHTKALIHHLAELAYEGELPYTAAFAIRQPGLSAPSRDALDLFYGRLGALYPYAAHMFKAFHRHAALDLDLRHEEPVFYQLCRQAPGLSTNECRLASETMRAVAELFILFFEGIGDAYAGGEQFAPRRPLYIEAVGPLEAIA